MARDIKKTESALLHAAAQFVSRESNRTSLITVTRVQVDDRTLHAHIYVSIYPESQAKTALEFLKRVQPDFRDYIKKNVRMHMLPMMQFLQDPNIGGLTVEEVPKG